MRELPLAREVLIAVALVTVGGCTLWAQAEPDDDSRLNTNLGGVMSVPLNPTARFASIGGGIVAGAGYDFSRRHAVVTEFMWDRLSSTDAAIDPLRAASQSVTGYSNLYSITANYRFELRGEKVGAYFIGGGGWYYRHNYLSNSVTPPTGTVCTPIWLWWEFTCASGTVTANQTIATSGSNVLGGNGGIGVTERVGEAPYRVYFESRYHYAPTKNISTQLVTVSIGIRY
jgi:hypothetical protein